MWLSLSSIHPSVCLSFASGAISFKFCVVYFLHFKLKIEQPAGESRNCVRRGRPAHTHPTPPPSHGNFSGGKLSGSNRLRERERHWRWKEVKVIGGTLREMFVVHLQIEFMAKGLKWMCFKDLQGAAMAAGAASALAGPGAAAAPKAKRYRIAHIQHPHRSQFGSIVF